MIGSLTSSDLSKSSTVIKRIWAVQIFRDRWDTIYLCTFAGDAEVAYHDVLALTTLPARLVWFAVPGAEFVATHATDYAVCESRA